MKGDNILAFIGGAIAGAAIALLFAPETGDQTRKKIKETYDKIKSYKEEQDDELEESAQEDNEDE